MDDDAWEEDMLEIYDDELKVVGSPINEEVPFVEVPKPRRLEDWVAVAPRSIASHF